MEIFLYRYMRLDCSRDLQLTISSPSEPSIPHLLVARTEVDSVEVGMVVQKCVSAVGACSIAQAR